MKKLLNDEIFVNKEGVLFSSQRLAGFHKWSEIIESKFHGYNFNFEKKVIENDNADTLNLDELK